jgi:hypothetical protein
MKSDAVMDDVYPPAGGWGSANAVLSIFVQEHAPAKAASAMLRQNKPDGFACVSCSWAKPAHPHTIEACENGLKATAWERAIEEIGAQLKLMDPKSVVFYASGRASLESSYMYQLMARLYRWTNWPNCITSNRRARKA